MKNKMTINEFKNYVVTEATKLYKIEILKEKKQKIEGLLSEIDKRAMNAAKKDIESEKSSQIKIGLTTSPSIVGKFEPLGKNKFEKNINKKELKKAMSPEKVDESEEMPEELKNYSDPKEQPGYIHEKKIK